MSTTGCLGEGWGALGGAGPVSLQACDQEMAHTGALGCLVTLGELASSPPMRPGTKAPKL